MTAFVIDASAVGPLIIPDEAEPHGLQIERLIVEATLIVPPHWPLEVANMLLVAMRRARLTDARRTEAVQRLEALSVAIDTTMFEQAWRSCFDLAVADNLTVYDAAYLELARRNNYGLLTLDGPLSRAAKARGVETPLQP